MITTTRFAPSPTGVLHLGSIRTALFCWLYARHTQGRFLVRIEDTDRERSTPENVDAIFEGLAWLGLDSDDDPVFQTSRFDRYREVIDQWLEDGTAEATVERKRAEARARVQLARERLAGHGLRVPDVAYHAWLDLPDTYESASRLVEDARRRGVVVTSGEAFRVGNGSAPSGVRLSLSAPPSRALLDDGLRRLTETLADAGRGPGPVIV